MKSTQYSTLAGWIAKYFELLRTEKELVKVGQLPDLARVVNRAPGYGEECEKELFHWVTTVRENGGVVCAVTVSVMLRM